MIAQLTTENESLKHQLTAVENELTSVKMQLAQVSAIANEAEAAYGALESKVMGNRAQITMSEVAFALENALVVAALGPKYEGYYIAGTEERNPFYRAELSALISPNNPQNELLESDWSVTDRWNKLEAIFIGKDKTTQFAGWE